MKLDLKDIKTQMDWMKNNITIEDRTNIALYTSDSGPIINEELRKNKSSSIAVHGLDELFKKIPAIESPIVLYRSIDAWLGAEYKDLGFVSTTWDCLL